MTIGGPSAALLLLTDGRLPAGAYAHSGGLEPSIAAGRVFDVTSLESFLVGRVLTAGTVAAAFAAAACGAIADEDPARLEALDGELDARMPSPAQRSTSRQLGRQLVRAVGAIQPQAALSVLGSCPHLPVALGASCASFALGRRDAALATLHDGVVGPATAAVRLLSLDPYSAFAVLARLTPLLDDLARRTVEYSYGAVGDLPAGSSPLLDLCAQQHAGREARLFAS